MDCMEGLNGSRGEGSREDTEILTVVLHGKYRSEDHHHLLFSIDSTVSLPVMAFESCSQPSGREWKTKQCITFKMLSTVWEQHTRVFFFMSKALG